MSEIEFVAFSDAKKMYNNVILKWNVLISDYRMRFEELCLNNIQDKPYLFWFWIYENK